MPRPLPRRTFLRGAGCAIGLPFLEAMIPRTARAAGPAPQRFAAFYFANGVVQQGAPGTEFNYWTCTPGTSPTSFQLSRSLQPLAQYRSDIIVLDGLFNSTLYTSGGGGAHWASTTGFLAGQAYDPASVRLLNPGRSVDQGIADALGAGPPLRSLVLGTRPTNNPPVGDQRGSGIYFNHVSWLSQTQMAFRHATSASVFDALFTGAAPSPTVDPLAAARRAARKSVLDFAQDDAAALARRLGSADRQRLDEYLTGLNELEKRIDAEVDPAPSSPVCDHPLRSAYESEDLRRRVTNMLDLMTIAFRCDLTRVCSFMLETEHNYDSLLESSGVTGRHHDISHYRMNNALDGLVRQNLWQVQQLAAFIQRLEATADFDGRTLLDNSVVLFGTGCGDGDSHKASQTPAILAGRGTGLATGRLYQANGARYANLLLTLAQRFGVQADRWGDSNGTLAGL